MSQYLHAMRMNGESYDDDEYEEAVLACVVEQLEEEDRPRRRGSIKGHNITPHNRIEGQIRLYNDYFAKDSVFKEPIFRRRFRMKRPLFFRIHYVVESHDPYFVQIRNATGVLGLSSLQKVISALRMLAYDVVVDQVDEYLRIGETTGIESLKRFVKVVVEVFGDEYLRSPNTNDLARLLAKGKECEFPRMLGSIDCMHWKWNNCSTA